MKKLLFLFLCLSVIAASGCGDKSTTVDPPSTPEITPIVTPSETPAPSAVVTPTPSPISTPEALEEKPAPVSNSGISDADYRKYNEIMAALNKSPDKSEEEIFKSLEDKYGATASELRDFMDKNMEAAIKRDSGTNKR